MLTSSPRNSQTNLAAPTPLSATTYGFPPPPMVSLASQVTFQRSLCQSNCFCFFFTHFIQPYCLCFCTFGHTSDLVRALSLLYSSTAKRQVICRPLLTCVSVQWVSLDCYAPLLLLIGILTSGPYLLAFCRFWSYTWFYLLMQICCCTSHLCLCFVHFA